MKNKIIATILALVGVSTTHAQSEVYQFNLSPEQFAKYIKSENIQILDVRTPDEFFEFHLKGAVNINIYDEDFESQVKAELSKYLPVAVYCRSGKRSAEAAKILKSMGFNVKNLDGGIISWKKSNLPIATE